MITIRTPGYIKKAILAVICILAVLPASLCAGYSLESMRDGDRTRYIPLDNPAYDYLDRLQERGLLPKLVAGLRPYTRLQVLEAIRAQDRSYLGSVEQAWLDNLEQECLIDIIPAGDAEKDGSTLVVARAEASAYLRNERPDRQDTEIGASFGGRFGRVIYDFRLLHAPHLLGYSDTTNHRDPNVQLPIEEGIIRPMEGYLKADYRFMDGKYSAEIFFGRIARNWSPSLDGSLIMNSEMLSIDQLALTLRSRHFVLTHFIAQLDGMDYRLDQDSPYIRANRFLTAHRLDIMVRDNIRFGVTETVVYGGAGKNFDLALMNPLTSYRLVAIQAKEDHANNTWLSLDGLWQVNRSLGIWGQWLVDDLLRSDQYQDRWALELGARLRDVFFLDNSTLMFKYGYATSFVYNTFSPPERYLFYGRQIGSSLGNDYNHASASLRYFLNPELDLGCELSYAEHGRQRVAGSLNDFQGSAGLEHPTSPVEKRKEAALNVRWQPVGFGHIDFTFGASDIVNRNNHQGLNSRRGFARLNVRLYETIPVKF